MYINQDKLIRIIRLMLGVLIAFAISWYYSIPDNAWIYVSLTVISFEQVTIGGVINRGFQRFLPTTISIIYSLLVIWLFNNNDIMNLIAVLFGIFVYIMLYFGTADIALGTLGSITLIIVLFNNNSMVDAFMRPFNIYIGIALGLFLNRFFYPRYASSNLIYKIQEIILYLNTITDKIKRSKLNNSELQSAYLNDENLLIAKYNYCKSQIADARYETLKSPDFILLCNNLLPHLRQILRYYSSVMYTIVIHKVNDKVTLDILDMLFAVLQNNFITNYRIFALNETTINELTQLIKTIPDKYLCTLMSLMLNECLELSAKFVAIRDVNIRIDAI